MTHRPKHLGHVNLYVRNAERSRQWYEDVLGLHTYDFRPGLAAFMSADRDKSHEVALMQVGDDAPLQQKGQVGLNHLAFMMESLDDLKEAYLRLKEKKVKIDRIGDHGVSLGIYFHDPDGNAIEFIDFQGIGDTSAPDYQGRERRRAQSHLADKMKVD